MWGDGAGGVVERVGTPLAPTRRGHRRNAISSTDEYEETVTVSTTPDRAFFDKHMEYLFSGDLDGLFESQYRDDAILIVPAVSEGEPPSIVPRAQFKEFFGAFLDYYGELNVDSLDHFVALDDSIFFQAMVSSPKAGRWVMGEAWHMIDGKIDRQYDYVHKLD